MRRLATVLSAAAAALLLVSAPALAAPGKDRPASHSEHEKAKPAKPAKKPAKPVKREIEVVGLLTATPTATIAIPSDTPTATIASDTATATITLKVKGGERSLHGRTVTLTVDGRTVVRRAGVRHATLADLRLGDHLSVKARRAADGTWYAVRVNAAGRPDRR